MDFKKINTLIWDWNGTLIDDVLLCLKILNEILKTHNIEAVTLEEYRKHFQMPVRPYYDWVGILPSDEEYHQISLQFHETYEAERRNCSLCKDVNKTLNNFKNNGFTQSILSAHEQNRLVKTIDEYDLTDYFTFISGSNNIQGKSKTQNGIELLKKLEISPKEALLIGDTIHDFEVAQEMECQCILVSTGHYSKKRLQTTGVPVIHNVSELENILKHGLKD